MYITSKEREYYLKKRIQIERELKHHIEKKQEFAELGDFSENEEYHIEKKLVAKCTLELSKIDEKLACEVRNPVDSYIGVGSRIHLIILDSNTREVVKDMELEITTIDTFTPLEGYLQVKAPIYSIIEGQKKIEWEALSLDGKNYIYQCELITGNMG